MANDNEILIRLAANSDNFKSGIMDATGSLEGFMRSVAGAAGSSLGLTIAAAGTTAALFKLTEATAEHGEHLNTLSQRTGIVVEDLSLLKFVADQSETSIDEFAGGIKFLQKNMVEAAAGNEKAVTLFKALGTSVKDAGGQMRPVNDVMLDVADTIKSIQAPSLDTTLMLDAMGRGAIGLLPMFNEGSEGIIRMKKEAEALGYKWSTEAAQAADKFNDSLGALKGNITNIADSVGKELIPQFTDLINWFKDTSVTQGWGKSVLKTFYEINAEVLRVSMLLDKFGGSATSAGMLLFGPGAALGNENSKKQFEKLAGWNVLYEKRYEEHEKALLDIAIKYNKLMEQDTEKTNTAKTTSVKKHTDAQIIAILGQADADKTAAEAYKKLLEENKQFNASYIQDIENILDTKEKLKNFDDDYFDAYVFKLRMTGKTEEQIAQLTARRKKEIQAGWVKDFTTGEEKNLQTVITVGSLEEQAARGLADTLKLLWSDQEVSFSDAWHNALNIFVDVTVQMMVQGKFAADSISFSMAAATAGISLVVGLIASTFGGGGGGDDHTATARAVKAFLDHLKRTLKQFESEIVDTVKNMTLQAGNIRDAFTEIFRLTREGWQTGHLDRDAYKIATDDLLQAVKARYNLEKGLIEDIMGLLKNQQAFVKDINQSITAVTRSTFPPEQMFAAQKGDIASLLASMNAAAGEDKIGIAGELKQAYLSYFETAKELFSGSDLAAIQQEVIAGLEMVKAGGVSGYDQLIDINLQMLGVQREGNDLAAQMNALLASNQADVERIIQLFQAGLSAAFGPDLNQIRDALIDLDPTLAATLPHFASGGIVTQRTLAIIGENPGSRGEAVIPLEQLDRMVAGGGGRGGGGNTFNFSFPNIRDFRDITVAEAEHILKGSFRLAAERLGSYGYTWGMKTDWNAR